jgi:Type VI secretion system effector, Hcp
MFIKIDTIDGEAQDTKHKKEIDVLSWSWGMSNSGSAHVGGGAERERSMFRISPLRSGLIVPRRSWPWHAVQVNIFKMPS